MSRSTKENWQSCFIDFLMLVVTSEFILFGVLSGGGHQGHHRQEALSSIAATLNQMNLNTNQGRHDRGPPRGGPPPNPVASTHTPAVVNPQAAAAVAALAASSDVSAPPPLEQHYQYNGTPAPTGWPAPPPRHPQWQEPEPQQQQQPLSSSTTSSIQVQAVRDFTGFY